MSFGLLLFIAFFREIMLETFSPPSIGVGTFLPPFIAWLIEFPPSIGWYALALMALPVRFLQYLTKRKRMKITNLPLENILSNNKKNFQILHEDITQVKIYSKHRLRILTKNGETHEFVMSKEQFKNSKELIYPLLDGKVDFSPPIEPHRRMKQFVKYFVMSLIISLSIIAIRYMFD